MKYGIGYKGSKSRIAEKILEILPEGERFCDLFGGGFAVSHAALLSGKYKSVLYSEIEPTLVQLVRDAVAGKFNADRFNPTWISRDEFQQKNTTMDMCAIFGVLETMVKITFTAAISRSGNQLSTKC